MNISETIISHVTVTDTVTGTSELIRTPCLHTFLAESAERYTSQGYSIDLGDHHLNQLSHPIPSILEGLEQGYIS